MSEELIFKGSFITPEVRYISSEQTVMVCGRSIPSDATRFYNQLSSWIFSTLNNKSHSVLRFHFYVDYLNTASKKLLYGILDRLILYKSKNKTEISISWFVEEDDESMLVFAEDMVARLNLPIFIYEVKEEDVIQAIA